MRLAATLLALLPLAVAAAPQPDDGDALVFITAKYTSQAQLQRIASRFQHLIVDPRTRTIQVEASRDDILALRRDGVQVQIDDRATERMREAETAMARKAILAKEGVISAESIPGYSCYRTVEETYTTMSHLAAAKPKLARVINIGPTWLASTQPGNGYQMKVLRLTNSATDALYPDKANMVVFASIHAREYTPAELATRFAEQLVNGYGTDDQATWLLDNFRFHFVLQANPDGRKKAEAGLSWRKNVDDNDGVCSANAYGIDLNRNFPFHWNGVAGGSSGDPCASTYRGPSGLSEPEARNLLRYVAGTPDTNGMYHGGALPDLRGNAAAPASYKGIFLDLHSYARRVLWPWSYTGTLPPNAVALRTLGRRLAFFNDYTPQQWIGMYAADGTDTDAVYGLLGAPSYTLEMGVSFFESCSTFQSRTLPQNLSAMRYAARNLFAPYRAPGGPDATAIRISARNVAAGTPVTITATVDDSRFNQNNGTEPVQRIASAVAYLDKRPWVASASPIAMRAADGAFNSSREVVTVRISTTGLRAGKHVVTVRGKDASGRLGTPRAIYFTVGS